MKGRPAISVIRIQKKWFKYIYSLCGAQQLSKTPTAPNKAELQKIADFLLDAFVAPWKDREPTALSVSEVAIRELKMRTFSR